MTRLRGGRVGRELMLFDLPDQQEPDVQDQEARGRSAELIAQRNEHIFHRFVHYRMEGEGKWTTEYIYALLKREFYLSPSTLGQLIEENRDEIIRIRKEWPGTAELNKRWPPPRW